MRSVNALTCLATLGAISSVSAGPFSWLHIRQEATAPIASAPITANATSDVDASVTVDGKNVSVAELYAYLNGTSVNVTSMLNSTANATHSITFDAESETDAEEEIELELTYSSEGEAVLSFLNGTQLCKSDEACREIVGEELGLTSEEVIEVEECADEIEEEEDEECDDEEEYEDDDEECEDGEYEEGEASATSSPASSSPVANNWHAAPTSTAASRSHVYHVAAATNVASGAENVPTSTATSYMYVTSGAPADATGTPFPSASSAASQEQDDNTVTVTQYVTITVDRFIVGPSDAATIYLSTSTPAATKGSNVGNNFAASSGAQAASGAAGATSTRGASSPASTGSYYDSPDSPDTPDTPDTPDSPDSADDGYGNIEDCEEDEWEEIPEDEQEDDEEWECTEEEVEGEDVIVDVSEYYNSTDCEAILSINATEVNATYVDLIAWCSNITSTAVPVASPEASVQANETATAESFAWSADASASSSASNTESWSAEATAASSTESAWTESSTESASTETASESVATDAVTSYVDVWATEYVQPSASASSSAEVPEATEGETLSRRLSNGFRRVRRSHIGRSAFV